MLPLAATGGNLRNVQGSRVLYNVVPPSSPSRTTGGPLPVPSRLNMGRDWKKRDVFTDARRTSAAYSTHGDPRILPRCDLNADHVGTVRYSSTCWQWKRDFDAKPPPSVQPPGSWSFPATRFFSSSQAATRHTVNYQPERQIFHPHIRHVRVRRSRRRPNHLSSTVGSLRSLVTHISFTTMSRCRRLKSPSP